MEPGQAELVAAQIGANASLLAAGIAGVVAAAVFGFGELSQIRRARLTRQNEAVVRLYETWSDVAAVSAPMLRRRWMLRSARYPERVDVGSQSMLLATMLSRRDRGLITLQLRLNDELVRATTDRQRTNTAAEGAASLAMWLRSRPRGRGYATAELARRGIAEYFDGTPVKARPE